MIYSPGVLFGPSFYMPTSYGYAPPVETVPAAIPRGGLRFDTSPGSAQVYVDGFYTGLVVDFGISGRALDLETGAHRIELRAAGYATLGFDVSIPANQTVRYRGDLEPISPAAPPTADLVAAPKAKTMYVIPNCYAGDRPPVRALPRGCDIKQLQIRN
jgi:PEGA domain-containing protein